MAYKVFLVEDEIVAREGIRDNIDWKSAGFEFCGEAPDGEIALPRIEAAQPDVLITDIKMPFMDGLQLTRLVRERMPWVKVIILSGHDEFNYAQAAVKLGVTEYLLKPVSAQDLGAVLSSVAAALDQERLAREDLKQLRQRVDDSLALEREKFLLRLILGGESSAEAIEHSQQLGLDILANYYLVQVIQVQLCDGSQPFDYQAYKQVEALIAEQVAASPRVFLTKKDLEELLVLVCGDQAELVVQESARLAEALMRLMEQNTSCGLAIDQGSPKERLGEIHHSFAEALVKVKSQDGDQPARKGIEGDRVENWQLLDHAAVDRYLKFGLAQEFEEFFAKIIQPVSEAALRSDLLKHYLFVDLSLTVAQFVSDLGGVPDEVIPQVYAAEFLLGESDHLADIKAELDGIFSEALAFRDSRVGNERALIVQRAQDYIDRHFGDADLSLPEVAGQVNLSPGHLSTVFSQEAGETFRDYLSRVRIERAKQLLRTTNQTCAAIAYQCGYNDPHYFSSFFKKQTGLTPQEFRARKQNR